MTLEELTGQESGIIVFPHEIGSQIRPSVGVYNWTRCGNEELPIMFGNDYIGLPYMAEERLLERASGSGQPVDDVRDMLPGSVWLSEYDEGQLVIDSDMNILVDFNNDLPRLFLGADGMGSKEVTAGIVYTLEDGTTIIAPREWA